MKLEYDFSDNFFKYYNEVNGIFCLKKKLVKKHNTKIISFTVYMARLLLFMLIALASACFVKAFSNDFYLIDLMIILLIIAIVISLLMILETIRVSRSKKVRKKGVLELDKDGIKDITSLGYELQFKYEDMEMIIVTENCVVTLFKNGSYLLVLKKDKNKYIKEVKKYKDVLVINNK